MEDKSFLYFLQDDFINKIDIDPRLVPSFKRILTKIQNYFNANNYTKERNYQEFLEKNLLNSSLNNMRFYVGKIEKKGVSGFYNKSRNEICINENQLNLSTDTLDSTLCHEFIHFLVMHDLIPSQAEPEIINGGFINEALTEMLTQKMYPNSNAYDAQVALHKYANLLSDEVNNYSRFLKGFVDARRSTPDWINYVAYANEFQKDFSKQGYISLALAQTNKNFIEAQRHLLNLFIKPNVKKSFDEYIDCIKKLSKRVVSDNEYVNQMIKNLDQTMVESIKLKDNKLNELLLNKLAEIRSLVLQLEKYKGNQVYEFEIADRKLAINENLNIFGNLIGVVCNFNPNNKTMTLNYNNDVVTLNLNDIDFNQRNEKIQSQISKLSQCFDKDATSNITKILKALEQEELTKLEKFTLPQVGFPKRKAPYNIYVATYKDKVAVLNNYEPIGSIENISLNHFIGMTSRNSKVAAIQADKVGTIKNGIMFTTLVRSQIEAKAVSILASKLEKKLTQVEIEEAIRLYQASDDYVEDDLEVVRNEALFYMAQKKFNMLPVVEQEQMVKQIKNESDKFVISLDKGETLVATILGDDLLTAFESSKQVLYDVNDLGLFNDLVGELKKDNTVLKKGNINKMIIDDLGNLVLEKSIEEQTLKVKSNKEILDEVDIKLKELRQQFGLIVFQIEDLMKKNSQIPISSYQQDLTLLLTKRDNLDLEITSLMKRQEIYEWLINQEVETSLKATIFQIEKLLGIRICDYVGFTFDGQLKAPQIVIKDKVSLVKERQMINKSLEQLFYEGKLDLETYKKMRDAVLTVYNKMLAPASSFQSELALSQDEDTNVIKGK